MCKQKINNIQIKKVISFNPYCVDAIVHGRKIYENRTRRIKPGYYALHVTKGLRKKSQESFFIKYPEEVKSENELKQLYKSYSSFDLKTQRIQGNIIGIIEIKRSFHISDNKFPIEKHAEGPYAHEIEFFNFENNKQGIPVRGQLGTFTISQDIQDQIRSRFNF